MRILWYVGLLLTVFTAQGQQPSEAAIRQAVERQLREYPRSTLRDVYKNFFQDRFGPGHLLRDTAAAGAYLRRELASGARFAGAPYEPTGCLGNFYRVNLSVIREGLVDYPTYFEAFVRSVNGIRPMPVAAWRKEWARISRVLADMGLALPGYTRDSLTIDSLLQQGQYVMHHSQAFLDAYDPHYRIIDKTIFEREILPLIERGNPSAR